VPIFIPFFKRDWQEGAKDIFYECLQGWITREIAGALMSDKVSVTIYSKPGCHLCEEAKAVMLAAGCRELFTMTETNIETDPQLLALYRYEIPVIMIAGEEVFRHRLRAEEFCEEIRRRSEGKPLFST
jgi:hypothetical protein